LTASPINIGTIKLAAVANKRQVKATMSHFQYFFVSLISLVTIRMPNYSTY
jgi:hypothetical protein